MIDRITFTGADDSVDPIQLVALSHAYPFVEWGILFSESRKEFASPRFPSRGWLMLLYEAKQKYPALPLSAHLCGGWVRRILKGGAGWWAEYPKAARMFERIQINTHGVVHETDPDAFENLLRSHRDREFIMQADGVTDSYISDVATNSPAKVYPLFDLSGGAGQLPPSWPEPWPGIEYFGYAGGLGPENVKEQFRAIDAASGATRAWADMERRVRSQDDKRFDLDKVAAVCDAFVERIVERQEERI
jgi:hypothetical protein